MKGKLLNKFKTPKMMILSGIISFVVLSTSASLADGVEEEASSPHVWSANMMMTTEYVYRGITQSNEDPAIQVGIDYAHDPTGFYIGGWASSVEFNTGSNDGTQIETNLYGAFFLMRWGIKR